MKSNHIFEALQFFKHALDMDSLELFENFFGFYFQRFQFEISLFVAGINKRGDGVVAFGFCRGISFDDVVYGFPLKRFVFVEEISKRFKIIVHLYQNKNLVGGI